MSTMEKYYINIGRQLGAGGLKVANELSKRLNIPVYDKELLYLAAKESGIAPEFFKNVDEKPQAYLQGSFWGLNFSSVLNSDYSAFTPLDSRELFRIQSDTIKMIAEKQSAIFVGRCADYVLRDRRCFNLFISSSSPNERIERVRHSQRIDGADKLSDKEILSILEKGDKKRSQYYNYYTYKEWGFSSSYDLCLDSAFFGIDRCVDMVVETLKAIKYI